MKQTKSAIKILQQLCIVFVDEEVISEIKETILRMEGKL